MFTASAARLLTCSRPASVLSHNQPEGLFLWFVFCCHGLAGNRRHFGVALLRHACVRATRLGEEHYVTAAERSRRGGTGCLITQQSGFLFQVNALRSSFLYIALNWLACWDSCPCTCLSISPVEVEDVMWRVLGVGGALRV